MKRALAILISIFIFSSFAASEDAQQKKNSAWEKSGYGVKLISYDKSRRKSIQRSITKIDGIELSDSERLLREIPVLLTDNLIEEDAETLKTWLERDGCEVEIKKFPGEPVHRKTLKRVKGKAAKRKAVKDPPQKSNRKKSREKKEQHEEKMKQLEEERKARKKVIASRLVDEEQIKLREIKFFEGETVTLSPEGRKYSKEFPKATTRYIFAEMSAINPLYGKDMGPNYAENFSYDITYKCYNPAGEYWGNFSQDKILVNIKEDEVVRSIGKGGIGPKAPNTWEVGTYKVEARFGIKKLGESSFTIIDK